MKRELLDKRFTDSGKPIKCKKCIVLHFCSNSRGYIHQHSDTTIYTSTPHLYRL